MKTKLLSTFTIALLSCMNLSAQITVTSANLAPINTMIISTRDTAPLPSIVPGPAGASQTWNFSALRNQKRDTLRFKVPSATPYASTYPGANIAIAVNNYAFYYIQNTAAAFYIEGAAVKLNDPPGNNTLKEIFTPHSMDMKWPSTFNTNYIDNYVVTGLSAYSSGGFDSLRLKNTYKTTCNIDAWGNITTPFGTFASLRQKRHITHIDSIWVHNASPAMWFSAPPTVDTTDHYSWWTNHVSAGYPLMEMDVKTSNGVVSGVTWLFASPLSVISLGDFTTFNAYPNPANDYINVKMKAEDASFIAVMDMSGRIALTSEVVVNDITTVNTESLQNGMYFLVITGKNGQRSTQKFSIVR